MGGWFRGLLSTALSVPQAVFSEIHHYGKKVFEIPSAAYSVYQGVRRRLRGDDKERLEEEGIKASSQNITKALDEVTHTEDKGIEVFTINKIQEEHNEKFTTKKAKYEVEYGDGVHKLQDVFLAVLNYAKTDMRLWNGDRIQMALSFSYSTPFGRTQHKSITTGKVDVMDEPFGVTYVLPLLDVVSYHGVDMSEIRYDVTGWMVPKGSGRGHWSHQDEILA